MSVAVRISESLAKQARVRSKVMCRSFASQIEYWAKIGEVMEDNPELPYSFVKDILISKQEASQGHLKRYEFEAKS